MSRKYKVNGNDQLYFVSFAVVNWTDLFIRNEYKDPYWRKYAGQAMCVSVLTP
ncbi:MAG TPA: hypothetical protein PLA68_12805 [Panacibacter sp.]|nr:hypothetical protein [Panacibacter sp.]